MGHQLYNENKRFKDGKDSFQKQETQIVIAENMPYFENYPKLTTTVEHSLATVLTVMDLNS